MLLIDCLCRNRESQDLPPLWLNSFAMRRHKCCWLNSSRHPSLPLRQMEICLAYMIWRYSDSNEVYWYVILEIHHSPNIVVILISDYRLRLDGYSIRRLDFSKSSGGRFITVTEKGYNHSWLRVHGFWLVHPAYGNRFPLLLVVVDDYIWIWRNGNSPHFQPISGVTPSTKLERTLISWIAEQDFW